MSWLWALIPAPLRRAFIYVAIGLAAFVGLRAKWRHDGAEDKEQEFIDADRERADEIRRRARDADGNGVLDDDDRGYRD